MEAPPVALPKLLVASFLSLFCELAFIRWIPSVVHVVSFFNNLVLIACFLGLGIGMALRADLRTASRRALFRLAVVIVALALLGLFKPAAWFAAGTDYAVNEHAAGSLLRLPLTLIIVGVFAVTVWTMVPLGQLVGLFFDQMATLPAYSVNVAGSLAGVLAFALVSWFSLPPLVWFGVCIACVFALDRSLSNLRPVMAIVGALLSLSFVDSAGLRAAVQWSPYYKVQVSPVVPESGDLDQGFVINVNNQFLLSGLDLRDEAALPAAVDPQTRTGVELLKSYYNFPFTFRPPGRVLVLGSGAGNDVAAALRHGAERITAVEIDPVVLRYGREHHPERPYESPQVTVVQGDARAFLSSSTDEFDLIIFATLDAHGLLSHLGSVRLDSFVYTRESIEAARSRLADDGLMVLSFGPFREDVQYRQYQTVRSVFGRAPLYFIHQNDHRTIVAGATDSLSIATLPKQWRRIESEEIGAKLAQYPEAQTLPSDDWPHLYLRERRIPQEYLLGLAAIGALSIFLVRRCFRGAYRLDGHFFFLGSGFLLLETKNIVEFALLAGSTWVVNAAVIAVILLTILAANFVAIRLEPPRGAITLCYSLLGISLLLGYWWPVASWTLSERWQALLFASVYCGFPIFLAAVIFASTLRNVPLGTAALASNLLGAVFGGFAEYVSLVWGIRAISLIALALYACSFLALQIQRGRPAYAPN